MKTNKIPIVLEAGYAICIDSPDYAQMTKEQLISVIMKKHQGSQDKKGYIVDR